MSSLGTTLGKRALNLSPEEAAMTAGVWFARITGLLCFWLIPALRFYVELFGIAESHYSGDAKSVVARADDDTER